MPGTCERLSALLPGLAAALLPLLVMLMLGRPPPAAAAATRPQQQRAALPGGAPAAAPGTTANLPLPREISEFFNMAENTYKRHPVHGVILTRLM